MKKWTMIVMLCVGIAAVAIAQQGPRGPRPQGPPEIKCDAMKKLMEQLKQHRDGCEVCKTSLPPAGRFGPGGPGGDRFGKGRYGPPPQPRGTPAPPAAQ